MGGGWWEVGGGWWELGVGMGWANIFGTQETPTRTRNSLGLTGSPLLPVSIHVRSPPSLPVRTRVSSATAPPPFAPEKYFKIQTIPKDSRVDSCRSHRGDIRDFPHAPQEEIAIAAPAGNRRFGSCGKFWIGRQQWLLSLGKKKCKSTKIFTDPKTAFWAKTVSRDDH